ncbi:MAG: recombinase family protein [Firmicutes bacterium]|jgi:DNA invertase Pin-like site-specific DNA recombinase|nr:recombinase family protein [Bacillota bacterium]
MRALGVARVSTQEQANGDRFSIPHQRQRITDYCLQRNWEVVDVVEYVQSGGSNYRELQDILHRVEAEHIRVVVVNELDRLARDMVSTLLFLEDLQKVGCRFAAVADDLDLTTPDGELKMMILSVFAHYFRKQLARKVRGGMEERARQGKHHGGRPPYGFRFQGDKLEPHPEQAEVVRQIYAWYVHEGVGGREIAKRLNHQGIPTQTGHSQWGAPEILRLLRKPANVGDLQHGALEFYKERTGVTHKRHREEPLVVTGAHPGIVDRDTWEAAQRILQSRGQHSGRQADSPYLLSGLVYCGYCGKTMVVIKGGGNRRPRYTCRSYQMMGLCQANTVAVFDIEQAVLHDWLSRMTHPTAADIQAWAEWKTSQERVRSDTTREQQRLRRRLDDVKAMRTRAEDALLQGAFTIPQFKESQARVDREEARLQERLRDLTVQQHYVPTAEEAHRLAEELAAAPLAFQNTISLHERRELLKQYIQRIEIVTGEVTIRYAGQTDPATTTH